MVVKILSHSVGTTPSSLPGASPPGARTIAVFPRALLMSFASLRRLLAASVLFAPIALLATDASAIELFSDEETGNSLKLTGFFQPYFRNVQDMCVGQTLPDGTVQCTASSTSSTTGFGMTRARLGVEGTMFGFTAFKFELESIPQVAILEAQMNTRIVEGLVWRFGRYRVPYSGQELVSESRLAMDRAEVIRSTPGRQLGTSLRMELDPFVESLPEGFLNIEFGVFNGESDKARQPVNNIDDTFLYGGRVEISPFGAPSSRMEGDLRPLEERSQPILHIGGGWNTNVDQTANFEEDIYGADITFRWQGLFVYGEYMRANRNYRTLQAGVDRYAEGWNAQFGYMIPAPYLRNHLEIVGRVEYYDPETAAFGSDRVGLLPRGPGGGPASSLRLQGQQNYTGGINWYFSGHDLKLQVNYTHRRATEDWAGSYSPPDSTEPNNVERDDKDDTLLIQATYRF
jgi:hypothetical protein